MEGHFKSEGAMFQVVHRVVSEGEQSLLPGLEIPSSLVLILMTKATCTD